MNNKYDDFIITELGKLFKDKTVNNVMNCLNEYLNMEKMNKFIETKNMQEGKKEYENATKEKSGMDSIRGKLCEKIVKYAIECSLEEEHRNDIIIESRSKTISENFVMRSAQNLNLLKKFDVDLLLYNKQLQNKYYCLSIKNSTRERIGQS
jgi:prophage tail gpP-like protein